MTGAVLVAFLSCAYFPHVFFRLCAERYVDLGRPRDASQFDEVLAALMPSAVLHLQTWAIIGAMCLLPSIRFPRPDWQLVLSAGSDGGMRHVAGFLSNPYEWMWAASYFSVLTLVTFTNALAFGRGMLFGLYANADPAVFPGARGVVEPVSVWNKVKVYVAASAFLLWKLFYHENFVWLFPWTLLKPFVFVKTKDSLFHGQFLDYEKAKNGEIDAIRLRQVSRFTREPIRQALAAGENPIRPLRGVLYLKWSEITDINATVPGQIERLWKNYERARRAEQSSGTAPLPQ